MTQIDFSLFYLQSAYWERLVRSHYSMMVVQASERVSDVDRSNLNS